MPRRLDLGGCHPGLGKIVADAFTLCAPPPNLTVSEWADKYRVLSADGGASMPGRWRTSVMEPMRGIMDASREPGVKEIVVIKGTQVGYTEFLLNTIGYFIDLDPCPILWLLPDGKAVDEISKNRLTPMLKATPRLAGKVAAPRSRDSSNTIAGKQFPGGRLAIVGSHAPNDISSRPIRLVICDETDRYALSAGVDGDPMMLATKRQQWYWNKLTIKGSSPTVKGRSVIARDYRLSDMRECYVACPHCAEKWNKKGEPPKGWQVLRWSQVTWDKRKDSLGKTVEHIPSTASYQCESCGVLWDDEDRFAALRNEPQWVPTAPFRGIAGFHYSQFYSTVVKLADVATEFLTAWGKLPGTSPDVQKQKVFINTVLAEEWEEEGESVDAGAIEKRGEPYGPQDLPAGALLVTAGVDVQGDRLEFQSVAWGLGEESWVVEVRVFNGDPAEPEVWQELDEHLKIRYRTVDDRMLRIKATCIDTGGHHAGEVHKFCKTRASRRIYPIKGANGPRLIWPGRSSRAKNNNRVFVIGVDTAKEQIYARLKVAPRTDPNRIDDPHPGRIHFPLPDESVGTELVNGEYYTQLTVETVITRYKNGKPYRVWHKPDGRRNEALDTFGYALTARMSLRARLRAPSPPRAADLSETNENSTPARRKRPPPQLKKTAPGKPRRDAAAIARMF